MRTYSFIITAVLIFLCRVVSSAQNTENARKDSLYFSGQLSLWGNYNHEGILPVLIGGRYIPTLDYSIKLQQSKLIDFEGAANILGTMAAHPFDTLSAEGNIRPYRAWARFSTRQLEVRLGLQKINFGSASLFRPLMWFDQLDPRDPLQLTNGVWGLLGRYYFLNNANIWLWCLYGNDKQRPWDVGKTKDDVPEAGGRIQYPIPKGELALSFHHRVADTRDMAGIVPSYTNIAENRLGFDGRYDFDIGLWFEGTWINKTRDLDSFTNQELFSIGADYTIGIGNGLHVLYEHLLYAYDKQAFAFNNNISFSGLSLSYPIGISDNLNAIVYYDWKNSNAYNFINWKHDFKRISLYIMGYLNPSKYNLPQQGNTSTTFAGEGIQVMLVYNH